MKIKKEINERCENIRKIKENNKIIKNKINQNEIEYYFKEKKYKEKITEIIKENEELIRMAKIEDKKYKKINDIINKNDLGKYFIEEFNFKENNFVFNIIDDKDMKKENSEFNSSFYSNNKNNTFTNDKNLSNDKTKSNEIYSNKNKIENMPGGVYYKGKKLKKINSFSTRKNNIE